MRMSHGIDISEAYMKLRDHPKLLNKWPPKLRTLPSSFGRGDKFMTAVASAGVLKAVEMELVQGTTSSILVLTIIERQGEEPQRSAIVFSTTDAEFRDHLLQTLTGCEGKTIQQIGDQEIDY